MKRSRRKRQQGKRREKVEEGKRSQRPGFQGTALPH